MWPGAIAYSLVAAIFFGIGGLIPIVRYAYRSPALTCLSDLPLARVRRG
jgi:hypothetical protein